jgi:aminoglycoside phosphotransferase (APT) family kinase protein
MRTIVDNHRRTDDLPILQDPAVPAAHLLGPGAPEAIGAVLAAVGGTVESSTPTQTTYYRGRSLTVAHQVKVRWERPGEKVRRSTETIVLSAGRKVPEGALVLSDGEHDIVAWRFPHDPWLPGLAPVLDGSALDGLLRQIGVEAPSPTVKVRAYRPGRRAVIEVTAPGTRVFLKVVPPRSAEALHRSHEALADAAPVPRSLGWSSDHGVVVLQAVGGRTLRQSLFGGFGLPGPEALLAVLDALPHDVSWDGEDPMPVDWRAHEFADLLASVMPEIGDRTTALADGLDEFEALATAEPVVAVHGDFYEAQLLVDGGAITGLLDVDTYGPGRRVDDLATMIGHLAVLAIGQPEQARIEAYAARLLDGFDHVVDPAVLRAGVAAVILGLATGSFRVLEEHWRHHTEARITAAEAWMQSARDLRAHHEGSDAS